MTKYRVTYEGEKGEAFNIVAYTINGVINAVTSALKRGGTATVSEIIEDPDVSDTEQLPDNE